MRELIIRKKRIIHQFIYLFSVCFSWIVIGFILFFLNISYTNIYTDNLVTIYLLLGFPINSLVEIMYLFFLVSTLMIIPVFHKIAILVSEEMGNEKNKK